MIIFMLALIGLALGSFVNALVWRIYMTEESDKKTTKKKSSDFSITKGRSMCPECRHELAVNDLIPVISWLLLRGKCRYCKKPISISYPLVETLTAILVIGSYVLWPFALSDVATWVLFALWAIIICVGVALGLYDLRWMIIPNKLVYAFNFICLMFLGFHTQVGGNWDMVINGALGALLFSGFFYILFQVSRGKWIGGGDVRLAIGLGLVLGWQKSILALTLAAYLGTFVILIFVILKKYHRKMKLPFGPFLLSATYLTFLFGQSAIDWYLRISGL